MLKQNKWKLLVTSLVVLLPIVAGLLLWNKLPDTVTTHWGASGEANGWSGKAFAVFGLPLILLPVHWLCVLLTGLDPNNKDSNRKMFGLVLWVVPVISVFANGFVLLTAMDVDFPVMRFEILLLAVMFLCIGNYLPKCKQNYTMGIKVRWTLNNEENWNKTHRFAGRLWVACGIGILPLMYLPVNAMVWLLPALLIVTAVIPVVYSWRLYKKQLADGTAQPKPMDKKWTKYTVISTVIVILILIGVAFLMFTGEIETTFGETSFTIEATYWPDLEVEYDAVLAVEYRETDDPGVRSSGFGSARLLMGLFENDEFGGYNRYSYTACDSCIVLTVDDRILVLNAKDEAATEEIYEQLVAHTEK